MSIYIIGKMKSQFFIDMLLWVSSHYIHQAYHTIYFIYFVYLKKNKNGNTKVCLLIPLSKKPLHIENSQPICIANQTTGSYTKRAPCKRNFRTNYSTYTKNKKQFSQSIVSFLFTLLNSAHKGSRNCWVRVLIYRRKLTKSAKLEFLLTRSPHGVFVLTDYC